MPRPSPTADTATTAVEDKPEQLSRVDRKRRDTRERIIREAEVLLRSRPVDEVTIQDMTEAADVGHGTFYLHFKSKFEVLIPIIEREAIRWDEIVQRQFADGEDPAVVLASSTRYMARAISADPLWRWLLQHSGVPVEDMRHAIGRFGTRDIRVGLKSGRFSVPELGTASSFLLGGFVNGLLASFNSSDPDRSIDQIAEMFLRSVGLETDEAQTLARQPLPPLL
ncbi:MAG: TetR family transcriptional regulator [Pseudomonadales bacterium]|nr:TetR family transcriptional regulator [Pseudomonadales bacterium]